MEKSPPPSSHAEWVRVEHGGAPGHFWAGFGCAGSHPLARALPAARPPAPSINTGPGLRFLGQTFAAWLGPFLVFEWRPGRSKRKVKRGQQEGRPSAPCLHSRAKGRGQRTPSSELWLGRPRRGSPNVCGGQCGAGRSGAAGAHEPALQALLLELKKSLLRGDLERWVPPRPRQDS